MRATVLAMAAIASATTISQYTNVGQW